MASSWSLLLDVPAYPAEGYAGLADRLARLLKTRNDLLLVQGEAIVALEAAAASLASPRVKALNVVTSPYGLWFGLRSPRSRGWQRRATRCSWSTPSRRWAGMNST